VMPYHCVPIYHLPNHIRDVDEILYEIFNVSFLGVQLII
jgi:hypothetical protein